MVFAMIILDVRVFGQSQRFMISSTRNTFESITILSVLSMYIRGYEIQITKNSGTIPPISLIFGMDVCTFVISRI